MTVEELPYYSIQVGEETLGSEVARLFEENKALPGVIVGSGDRLNLIARGQFYQRLGRLYGVEIYLPRAIGFFLESVSEPALIFPHITTIQGAVVACLARGENVYDPFLVRVPQEEPRMVTFLSLILKQTELLSVAQVEAQAQKSVAIAANQSKSEFLAVMSHELRTPLTAIIGYGEILLEDAAAGEHADTVSRARNIVDAGLHLLEMINGILDLAKVEAGKTELTLELFSMSEFLEHLTGTLIPLLARNNNEFRLITEKGLGEMFSDQIKLKQCLLNLLGNASKFTKNGLISLRVDRESYGGRFWGVFEISDTGIGMTDEQMEKLFEPFYQADSSISRRFGGTGLGLSLTKRFCEMLGGTLSVSSVVNQGSTFTMRLPMDRERAAEKAAERKTQSLPKTGKKRTRKPVTR
jgi:signal transduction histidine kinase